LTAATDDEAKITISVKPDGSALVYKGKVVGRTPFILKQPRGEKRTYAQSGSSWGWTCRIWIVCEPAANEAEKSSTAADSVASRKTAVLPVRAFLFLRQATAMREGG